MTRATSGKSPILPASLTEEPLKKNPLQEIEFKNWFPERNLQSSGQVLQDAGLPDTGLPDTGFSRMLTHVYQ